MNFISKIETRVGKGESLANLVTEENIYSVLEIVKDKLDPMKIFEQLDRKTCKVPLIVRLQAILESSLSSHFHNYCFIKNEFGETEINEFSSLANEYFKVIIKRVGFESAVNRFANNDVSPSRIYMYLSTNGFEDELEWYAEHSHFPMINGKNSNTTIFSISNDFATVLRMHLDANK